MHFFTVFSTKCCHPDIIYSHKAKGQRAYLLFARGKLADNTGNIHLFHITSKRAFLLADTCSYELARFSVKFAAATTASRIGILQKLAQLKTQTVSAQLLVLVWDTLVAFERLASASAA
jgi:hypothetical protein